MAGRPLGGKKSAAQKQRDGDTRKIGRHKLDAEIASEVMAQRGRPPFPRSLEDQELANGASEQQMALERRREVAREHWERTCDALQAENLLCVIDGGMIEQLSWNYAASLEAWAKGEFTVAVKLQAEYRQGAQNCCMTETSRAKVSRPPTAELSAADLALAADLPPEFQSLQ